LIEIRARDWFDCLGEEKLQVIIGAAGKVDRGAIPTATTMRADTDFLTAAIAAARIVEPVAIPP
jgi:hypothetical protein